MFEIIIPARNEENSIPQLLRSISVGAPQARIVVVDNASEDRTADVAREYGADEVVFEPKIGKGYAVYTGICNSKSVRPFFCDADVVGLDWSSVPHMLGANSRLTPRMTRLTLERSIEGSPVTSLMARPVLHALGHTNILEPLGGLFCLDAAILRDSHFPGGWGVDIALTLMCLKAGIGIEEKPCPGVSHRQKPLLNYVSMAQQVSRAIMQSLGVVDWDHSDCALCTSNFHQRNGLPTDAEVG